MSTDRQSSLLGAPEELGVILQYRSGHPEAENILDIFDRLADQPYRTHLLIHGESGTGTEGLARAMHRVLAARSNAPFVKIPSGGRDPQVLARQLFGTTDRPGAIDRAEGGTLFLDEVATLPREIQARLSPVLRGRYRRNDDEKPRACDVAVVGATDHDLAALVTDGGFRQDLYFRLSRIELTIPPLRERSSDVVTAALWVGNKILRRFGIDRILVLEGEGDGHELVLTKAAAELLTGNRWEGNFRALDRAMERALMLYRRSDRIEPADILAALGARSK